MFRAGDLVEIVDPTNRLYRAVGSVEYFVDDNIYVRFPNRRWRSLRMLFPKQLQRVDVRAPLTEATGDGSAPVASTQA